MTLDKYYEACEKIGREAHKKEFNTHTCTLSNRTRTLIVTEVTLETQRVDQKLLRYYCSFVRRRSRKLHQIKQTVRDVYVCVDTCTVRETKSQRNSLVPKIPFTVRVYTRSPTFGANIPRVQVPKSDYDDTKFIRKNRQELVNFLPLSHPLFLPLSLSFCKSSE